MCGTGYFVRGRNGGFTLIMLQTERMVSLPCGVNDIKSFAINHCDYLFLDCGGCKLIKWSKTKQTVETIVLERRYLCICYDHKENCYWAVSEYEPCFIYRLDACFREVGCIKIQGVHQQRALSICATCCGQGLWVCYTNAMAYVEKCGEKTIWDKCDYNRKINIGIVMPCRCAVSCYYENGRQMVETVSPCTEQCLSICVPKDYKIVGIAPHICGDNCGGCRFCVLLSKICSRGLVLSEYCAEFSDGNITPCPPPHPPHPPHPPEPHCGGAYEIMHSIALEEAGIAHILNAEGEKIQKAVAMSNNIEQLLCVNESVKRTLTQVTLLEGMLYSKLEAVANCDDCACKKKQPKTCK